MMICMCSLAGTAACKTCRNNPDSVGQFSTFVTGITTVTDTPQITYVPERTCQNNAPDYLDFLCSGCGFVHYHSDENDMDGGNEWDYCPNCGARVTPKNSETTPKEER